MGAKRGSRIRRYFTCWGGSIMSGMSGRMLPRSMGTSLQQNRADFRRASSTCSRRVSSVNMSSIRITGVSRSEREMARGSSEEARSATMPADVPVASSSACIRTPLAPGSGGTSDQGVVRVTQDVRCHHAHRPWPATLAFPDANVSPDSRRQPGAGAPGRRACSHGGGRRPHLVVDGGPSRRGPSDEAGRRSDPGAPPTHGVGATRVGHAPVPPGGGRNVLPEQPDPLGRADGPRTSA